MSGAEADDASRASTSTELKPLTSAETSGGGSKRKDKGKDKDKDKDKDKKKKSKRKAATPPPEEKHPLLVASAKGQLEKVQEIVRDIDDIDKVVAIVDNLGWTALHYSCQKGHEKVVKFLLDSGFPVDHRDSSGATPLYRATGFGHLHVIEMLADEYGADIHAVNTSNGSSMTINAAWGGRTEILRWYIGRGVSYTYCNKNGNSAMIDMIEKIPKFFAELMDTRMRTVAHYLQHTQIEYDHRGLDDQDPAIKRTPLELILSRGKLDLLAHPVIRTLLEFKWTTFARDEFLQDLYVYVMMLLLATYITVQQAVSTDAPWEYSNAGSYIRLVFEIILAIFSVKEIYSEYLEYRGSGIEQVLLPPKVLKVLSYVLPKSFIADASVGFGKCLAIRAYFVSGWNLFDLTTYLLILVISVVRALSIGDLGGRDETAQLNALSVAMVLLWVKLVQLVAVFRQTGPLVRIIARMLIDFAVFLVVYLLFLFAFASGFYLLLFENPGAHPWSTFPRALMSTYRLTLGDFDYDFIEESGSGLAIFWFVVATLVLLLIMLNLLIALFSQSFSIVYYVAEKQWLAVWGSVIIKIQRKLGKARVKQMQEEALERMHTKKATLVARATPADEGADDLNKECFFRWEKDTMSTEEEELSLHLLRADLNDRFDRIDKDYDSIKTELAELRELLKGVAAKEAK